MQCRKCGAKDITRRAAGVFVCQRCGVQPGASHMCRFGVPHTIEREPTDIDATEYEIRPRPARLTGHPVKAADTP